MKNRLRSTIAQEHLDAFMLIATEKNILMCLDTDGVINKVAEAADLPRQQLHVPFVKMCCFSYNLR